MGSSAARPLACVAWLLAACAAPDFGPELHELDATPDTIPAGQLTAVRIDIAFLNDDADTEEANVIIFAPGTKGVFCSFELESKCNTGETEGTGDAGQEGTGGSAEPPTSRRLVCIPGVVSEPCAHVDRITGTVSAEILYESTHLGEHEVVAWIVDGSGVESNRRTTTFQIVGS